MRVRILLVEDDGDVRDYTATLLEEAGYDVCVASHAEEAETWLRKGEPIDLLVADIVMPGRNGIDLAFSFRRLRPDAAILFVTGYTRHIAADRLEEWEILEKPYQRDALLHAVRRALGSTRSAEGAAARRGPLAALPEG